MKQLVCRKYTRSNCGGRGGISAKSTECSGGSTLIETLERLVKQHTTLASIVPVLAEIRNGHFPHKNLEFIIIIIIIIICIPYITAVSLVLKRVTDQALLTLGSPKNFVTKLHALSMTAFCVKINRAWRRLSSLLLLLLLFSFLFCLLVTR